MRLLPKTFFLYTKDVANSPGHYNNKIKSKSQTALKTAHGISQINYRWEEGDRIKIRTVLKWIKLK